MIAGTTPRNETTQPRILSFDFARITELIAIIFPSPYRKEIKLCRGTYSV